MLPVGALMKEHRIIERMVRLMKDALRLLRQGKEIDAGFIDQTIDFMRTYADRCHHGKEEDILFKELSKKRLSQKHTRILKELLEEHVYGRKTVIGLREAKENYVLGNKEALKAIQDALAKLVELYPRHIEKEDKHFFLPVMDYFDTKGQGAMLCEFIEFDRRLIHEKYEVVIKRLEAKR